MNTPSHYSLEELLRRWKLDDITVEQTVGQLILNMQSLSKRIGSLEKERVAQAKPPQTAPK